MPVKNRIFFIFSLYRFLDDFTQWVGTSLWGITLLPIWAELPAHSGLGSGGFMGVSAAKMDFCTAGLERFPR